MCHDRSQFVQHILALSSSADVSSVPYLRFIALSTMKEALLREWSSLPKQLPQELLVYLVHFVQGSTEE